MRYFSSIWIHDNIEDPILFASEVGDDQYEIRKIEIWIDGRVGWADTSNHSANTRLGKAEVPSTNEINQGKEFIAKDITNIDFDRFWEMKNEPAV